MTRTLIPLPRGTTDLVRAGTAGQQYVATVTHSYVLLDRVEEFAPEPDDPYPPDPEDSYPPDDYSAQSAPVARHGGGPQSPASSPERTPRWSDALQPGTGSSAPGSAGNLRRVSLRPPLLRPRLARAVRAGVQDAFGVTLVPEPVWIGVTIDG